MEINDTTIEEVENKNNTVLPADYDPQTPAGQPPLSNLIPKLALDNVPTKHQLDMMDA